MRIFPSSTERRSRLSFIEAEMGASKALQITLDAMKRRLQRKEEKATREAKEKRENFDTSPYANFWTGFLAVRAVFCLA